MTPTALAAPTREQAVEVIRRVPRDALNLVLTPSAVEATADLYLDLVRTTLRHGVDPVTLDMAPRLIQAVEESWRSKNPDVDVLGLMDVLARTVAQELGEELNEVAITGPVGIHPSRAYVVLARQPTTPPWGPYGDAPLVVILSREDYGGGKRGPWTWNLFPDVPGGGFLLGTVVAPPPSVESAVEVGQVVARALTSRM